MQSDWNNRHEAETALEWREFLPDVIAIFGALTLLHSFCEWAWSLVLSRA